MSKFELVPLENGLTSLRCLETLETFHPGIGPAEEARILHVEQQKIVERSQACDDQFVLWDVGLGAAANALSAIRALEQSRGPLQSTQTLAPFYIVSFDKSIDALKFAIDNATTLSYPLGYEKIIKKLLSEGEVKLNTNIVWRLHLGDFVDAIKSKTLQNPDAIFYDPYSSKTNAEMWSLEHFSNLYRCLDPKRPCLLSNYTASTYLRVTWLLAGFYVGYGTSIHKKNQTTVASNSLDLISKPLDRDWLENRAQISHSAAPIRDIPHNIAPLSSDDYQALCQHPQFI